MCLPVESCNYKEETHTHTHTHEPIHQSNAKMTETRHNSVNFTKSLLYAPTRVCKHEQQDLSPVGWSCCPHNSTTPPRGGFHLPSKYNPTIPSNASMSASVGRMTVPQCFSIMCESHGKYPRIPQVYQSHVRSRVGILLLSSLTGQGLKFGAKISRGQLTI